MEVNCPRPVFGYVLADLPLTRNPLFVALDQVSGYNENWRWFPIYLDSSPLHTRYTLYIDGESSGRRIALVLMAYYPGRLRFDCRHPTCTENLGLRVTFDKKCLSNHPSWLIALLTCSGRRLENKTPTLILFPGCEVDYFIPLPLVTSENGKLVPLSLTIREPSLE